METAVVDSIARAEQSVVAITRYRLPDSGNARGTDETPPFAPGGSRFDGPAPHEFATGVIIDARGYVLTNYHVLGDPSKNAYKVWVNRKPYEAVDVRLTGEIKAGDPWTDLAVLKVDAEGLKPITFGDAQSLRKGQIVIALGNPYGIARDGQVSASWGIVSNLSRPFPPSANALREGPGPESLYQYGGLIQTDARLNMGTSGGALVNLRGEMVGLITALAAKEGYERSMGFAIPVDDVLRRTVETLKNGRKAEFGFLGVSSSDVSDSMLRAGQFGARVTHVATGTPAAAARLKQDDIITEMDGRTIYDRDSLMHGLGRQPVGSEVQLTVERGSQPGRRGRVIRTSAILSKRHIDTSRPAHAQVEAPRWRGLEVDYATALPQELLQQAIQLDMPQGSLAAILVERDSPAWRSGLRSGAVFTHVNRRRVTTPGEFFDAVAGQEGPVRIRLVSGEVVVSP
jgi:serine protease Do